jgi:hypothetical protein
MGGRLWAKNREGGGSEFGFSVRTYPADEAKKRRSHERQRELEVSGVA